MYAHIVGYQIDTVARKLPTSIRLDDGTTISNFHIIGDEEAKLYGWHKMVIVDPDYDPETQIKEGPIDSWDGTTATRAYTVRDLTQTELDEKQERTDVAEVSNAVVLIGKLTIQLIDKLLTNNVIQATDFTPNVRQDYQNLKSVIDRISD